MAHGSSLVGHINADHVLTVRTYYHMLGAKPSPEKPNPNLFPNISAFTVILILMLIGDARGRETVKVVGLESTIVSVACPWRVCGVSVVCP